MILREQYNDQTYFFLIFYFRNFYLTDVENFDLKKILFMLKVHLANKSKLVRIKILKVTILEANLSAENNT